MFLLKVFSRYLLVGSSTNSQKKRYLASSPRFFSSGGSFILAFIYFHFIYGAVSNTYRQSNWIQQMYEKLVAVYYYLFFLISINRDANKSQLRKFAKFYFCWNILSNFWLVSLQILTFLRFLTLNSKWLFWPELLTPLKTVFFYHIITFLPQFPSQMYVFLWKLINFKHPAHHPSGRLEFLFNLNPCVVQSSIRYDHHCFLFLMFNVTVTLWMKCWCGWS